MRQFFEALRDVNVRVSEHTLLEVGRYFQSPTLKDRRESRHRDQHDSTYRNTRGGRDAVIDCASIEIAYIRLMDVVFGREK